MTYARAIEIFDGIKLNRKEIEHGIVYGNGELHVVVTDQIGPIASAVTFDRFDGENLPTDLDIPLDLVKDIKIRNHTIFIEAWGDIHIVLRYEKALMGETENDEA